VQPTYLTRKDLKNANKLIQPTFLGNDGMEPSSLLELKNRISN